jgi:hypothetical protein
MMSVVELLLSVIAVPLFVIVFHVGRIDARLKERFPTGKEQDYEWANKDPMGHWEAHQK